MRRGQRRSRRRSIRISRRCRASPARTLTVRCHGPVREPGRPFAAGPSLPRTAADGTSVTVNRRRTPRWQEGRRRASKPFALWRLALAAVLLCGIAHSGGHYFYCEALGLSLSDPCAQAPDSGRTECPTRAFRVHRYDCCALVVLPAMPESQRAERPTVRPAPILAIMGARPWVERTSGDERISCGQAFRAWRGPPRAPGEMRARLMVYLT